MKMASTVNHYWSNPRNNTSETFTTKSDAVVEAKKMTSDDAHGQCSRIFYADGNLIARRDWDKNRLTWI